jgi:hypothetical protein
MKIYRISNATDAEYLAAIENGNMEVVQRMVDEAALKAGLIGPAFHASKTPGISSLDPEKSSEPNFKATWFNLDKVYPGYGSNMYRAFLNVHNPATTSFVQSLETWGGKTVHDQLKAAKYDSVKNGNIIGVLDASNIKSGEPILYDNQKNIIPLSQRFP